MPAEMSEESLKEYICRIRKRYGLMKSRGARGRLLDEFCEVSGLERKYSIRVLRGTRRPAGGSKKRGVRVTYVEADIEVLKTCWRSMEQPCGKRMRGMIPLWINYVPGVGRNQRFRLEAMSPATIDRRLASAKIGKKKKPLVPRSDAAIKAMVEIRAERWETSEVGFTEVDTVAHCGGDMGGNFIWSLTSVEIASGWAEVRCAWNRGQHATFEGLESIEKSQPFTLKGIDSDGGGEFLNYHLVHYLKEREIKQTRSRPYRKNDQAHVEQKNYTHVRQFLGYDRLEHQELVEPLNKLLASWSLWKNLFCTTMEQTSTTRDGSKQRRTHVKIPQTPAARLMESGHLNAVQSRWIKAQIKAHNPFQMKEQIEMELSQIWKLRDRLQKQERRRGFVGGEASPLRSEASPPTRNQPQTQSASVSS